MRVLLPLFLSIGVFTVQGYAQDPGPDRSDSRPIVLSNPSDPPLPVPGSDPESQGGPELLPEATALPVRPPLLPLPGGKSAPPPRSEPSPKSEPSPTPPVTPEQMRENAKRLEQARTIAMRSPRVIYLLQQAKTALDVEARRNYLRAYYTTICTRMRRMEPDLTGTITDFEKTHIRQIGQDSEPKVPLPSLAMSEPATKTASRIVHNRGGKPGSLKREAAIKR